MTASGERILDSSAAEEIVGNEDLLTEILLRLPVKSLLRFESVSKKWLSLISNPYFAQNYSRRRNPNFKLSGLMLNHEYDEFQFLDLNDDVERVTLSYPEVPAEIAISQSCNGLLIYYSLGSDIPHICNPTTKQFTPIPFPSPEFEESLVAVNLAFDPLKSPHYKLLCVRMFKEQTPYHCYQIHIYSSETRSWRNPISGTDNTLIFAPAYDIAFPYAVYFKGAVHWYSYGETSFYFNIDTECLKTMPMPPLHEGIYPPKVWYFGESRGHLHLIVNDKPSALEFDILELKTDYSGWFVRYNVDLDAAIITFPDLLNAFSVLCVVRAEKEEESMLVLWVSGEAISFNRKDRTSRLCDLVPPTQWFCMDYQGYEAFQYIETLFHV